MRLLRRPKRDEELPSAIPAVFDTTELLETVLVSVDIKTLLLAQRVCRKWKAVINANPSIQKKLFLLPVDDIEEARDLGMLEPRLFKVPTTRLPPTQLGLCTISRDFVLPNTLLDYTWHHGRINLDVNSLSGSTTQRVKNKARNTVRKISNKPAIVPSWSRMLITQPPRHKIVVYHDRNMDGLPQEPRVAFYEEEPVSDSYWFPSTRTTAVIVEAWQVRRCASPLLESDGLSDAE